MVKKNSKTLPTILLEALKKLADKVKLLPENDRLTFLVILAATVLFLPAMFYTQNLAIICVTFIIFIVLMLIYNLVNKVISR